MGLQFAMDKNYQKWLWMIMILLRRLSYKEKKLSSRKRLKSASDAWSPKVTKLAWQTKHGESFATPPLRQCRDAAVSLACSSFAEVPPANPRDVARVGKSSLFHSSGLQVSCFSSLRCFSTFCHVFFFSACEAEGGSLRTVAEKQLQLLCLKCFFPMSNIFTSI